MSVTVSDRIPSGNVCDAVVLSRDDGSPEVRFAAHPHGGPEALWFCFRVDISGGDGPLPARLGLVLTNPATLLGGGQAQRMRPVYRGPSRDWTRLPPGRLRELPDGRRDVGWEIESPGAWVEVAYCYPYGPDELAAMLRDTGGRWTTDTVGVSQQGRPIVRLANDYGRPGGDRPGVYLVARQHSGETPGGWVLDGLLRAVAAMGDDAPLVWAVPFANIDGVAQGDYGKDNFPYDLNRAWGDPPMRYETLVLKQDLARWASRCRPQIVLDLHAPGAVEDAGVYAFSPDPEAFPAAAELARPWLDRLSSALTPRYAAGEFGRVARYRSRWETPGLAKMLWQQEKAALSLETPYACAGELVLERHHYQDIGARLARALSSPM